MIQVEGVFRTPVGGVFAIVMPYFEHDDFRRIIKTLTLSGVAAYTRSLLTALAHVHAKGVIHRDIKPRNFMYNASTGQGRHPVPHFVNPPLVPATGAGCADSPKRLLGTT